MSNMTFVLAIQNLTNAAPTIEDVESGATSTGNQGATNNLALVNDVPITAQGQLVRVAQVPQPAPGEPARRASFDVTFQSAIPPARGNGSVRVEFGTQLVNNKVQPFFGAQPMTPGLAVGVTTARVDATDAGGVFQSAGGVLFGLVAIDFTG